MKNNLSFKIQHLTLELLLGWRADENFDSGIVKTIEWYVEEYNEK